MNVGCAGVSTCHGPAKIVRDKVNARARDRIWLGIRKLLRLLSGTKETILDVLLGGMLNLRKLVVTMVSG